MVSYFKKIISSKGWSGEECREQIREEQARILDWFGVRRVKIVIAEHSDWIKYK